MKKQKTTVIKFVPVLPSPKEIAKASARRDHAQVLMSVRVTVRAVADGKLKTASMKLVTK